MSSSGDRPKLNITSTEPTAITSTVTDYLAAPSTSAGGLISGLIFGLMASVFVGIGQIISAVTDFITAPFRGGAEAITSLITGLLKSPVDILRDTADTTATAIAQQFGWMAYPIAVAIILVTLYMVNVYLQQRETGDTFPGLPFDTPDLGPFQIGVTEEGEDET